jgi:membrane protease YdiL (CAAX protease family)
MWTAAVYPSSVLSVKGSLVLVGLSFSGMLTGGVLLSGLGLGGAAAAEWLFVCGPALAWALAAGAPVHRLRLGPVRPRALAGGAIAGASIWIVVAYGLLPIQTRLFPIPPELEEALGRLVLAEEGFPWRELLALAVTPALCEELLFRGAVQPALVRRIGAPVGLVVTSVLFMLLHLDPHRFPATFALGMVFGLIALRTGSTWPSVLAHALSNAFVIVVAQPELRRVEEALERHRAIALAAAVGVLTIGLCLVWSRTKTAEDISLSQ